MPVVLSDEQVEGWRATLPEGPQARRGRFESQYGLPAYDAGVLVAERDVADFFEAAASQAMNPKAVSNWVMTDVLRTLAEREVGLGELKISPAALAALTDLVEKDTLNMTGARKVFEVLVDEGGDPQALVEKLGLVQVSDSGALEKFVDEAIAANPKSVADYQSGKKAAAQFLMGQVMKASRGKANPPMVMEMLQRKLND